VTRRAVIPLFATLAPHQPHEPHPTQGPHEPRAPHPPRGLREPQGHAGDGTARRVVFAGRVVKPKGLGVLIHAMRAVDAELVVCGDGMQLTAMRKLAHRLGMERRVHFRGWLNPDQLAQELADASVVAIPSLWPEPFGLVGIEALAAGRPVIASLTGGIPDWLENGVTGVGVRPGDALVLARALDVLLADPERQQAIGAAGREMVAERFSPERHVAALLETYSTARAYWEAAV
jgi:glycosyltransferase involved in cell wall biosynthesis